MTTNEKRDPRSVEAMKDEEIQKAKNEWANLYCDTTYIDTPFVEEMSDESVVRNLRFMAAASGFDAGAKWAQKNAWVKCSERMPPCDIDISGDHPHLANALKSDLVMCWFGSDRPSIGYFMHVIREQWDSRSETWFESEAEGSIDIEDVSHWMPLPEPPKEEPKE